MCISGGQKFSENFANVFNWWWLGEYAMCPSAQQWNQNDAKAEPTKATFLKINNHLERKELVWTAASASSVVEMHLQNAFTQTKYRSSFTCSSEP